MGFPKTCDKISCIMSEAGVSQMKELMLKLLTYEPYEKVNREEKEYIDAILHEMAGDTKESFQKYHTLFLAFQKNVFYTPEKGISWKQVEWENYSWLADWKYLYYPAENYMNGETRKSYPVLFKKICFFWLTEGNLGDKVFMEGIGLRQNILNKWRVSPRYRKLMNKDTYSSINLYRNGKKQAYLVLPIKAAYYESGRQTAPYRFSDLKETAEWIAPKADRLPSFIDVFAGTGTVAASMNTSKKEINDIDVGAVCFLYSMANDSKEVVLRLSQIYNNFVSRSIAHGDWYTAEDWEKHASYFGEHAENEKFKEVMIRIRNNYQDIQEYYVKATRIVKPDFENPTERDIIMFYDIGVAWLLLNSIRPKSYRGNAFSVTDMDIASCLSFLKNTLGIDVKTDKKIKPLYEKMHKKDSSDASFLEHYKIHMRQIKFTKGRSYMKTLKDARIRWEDFRNVIQTNTDNFLYLDSPYFLTSDYQVSFKDEEHKQMLDLLRESSFHWLFSMQYKEGHTKELKKHNSQRAKDQREGNPLIKNYREYLEGFLHPFTVVYENGLPYYVADTEENSSPREERQLWVMLFADSRNVSGEMMICNFDVRRVFPYGTDYDKHFLGEEGVVVFPLNVFLDVFFPEDGKYKDYEMMLDTAKQWRKNNIIENYALGVRV